MDMPRYVHGFGLAVLQVSMLGHLLIEHQAHDIVRGIVVAKASMLTSFVDVHPATHLCASVYLQRANESDAEEAPLHARSSRRLLPRAL